MSDTTSPTNPTRTGSDGDEAPLQVGILIFDGVEPLDFVGPAQVFWSLGSARRFLPPFRQVDVHLVAESSEPVTAGYGFVVHPTVDYARCPPLDIVIVPGGTGGEEDDASAQIGRRFQAHNAPTLAFVAAQQRDGCITTSVCTGAFILAGAGVLRDHRANTHWYARDELVEFMAERGEAFELVTDRVVDDGAIVTAGGVSSGIELALHLLERVLGADVRNAAHAIIERETPAAAAPASA